MSSHALDAGNHKWSLHDLGKKIAVAVLPKVALARLKSIRSRNYRRRYLRSSGILQSTQAYIHHYGWTVRNGPFAGMRYTPEAAADRPAVPMLLGSCEEELHPVIQHALREPYAAIINVGCAEGYYLIGFALRGVSANVIGYEIEPRERALARALAKANGVSVEIRGAFRARDLRQLRGQRAFVLCDCQGAELDLFTAQTVHAVMRSDLLIELHGDARSELPELFAATHEIALIGPRLRNPDRYPELSVFPANQRAVMVSEHRGQAIQWLWARARELGV